MRTRGALTARKPSTGGRRHQVEPRAPFVAQSRADDLRLNNRLLQHFILTQEFLALMLGVRGAERRLANGGEPETARDVERLRHQYGQLTAHLAGEGENGEATSANRANAATAKT